MKPPSQRKPQHEEKFLCCKGAGALEQAAQRCYGVCFSGEIPDSPGPGPVQPAVDDPALAGQLAWIISGGPFHSVILNKPMRECQ